MNIRTSALAVATFFALSVAAGSWAPARAIQIGSSHIVGGQCVNAKSGKPVAASDCKGARAKPASPGDQK
jgi:hypothetical protein